MHQLIAKHIRNYIHPSGREMQIFLSSLDEISVSKNSFLLKPGTLIKDEYFVIKGCLKAYYMDVKGNKHILQFAVENWWIGDFEAFYNNSNANLYIEAIEDSTLLSVNYDKLQSIYNEAPIFERYFRILITKAYISQQRRILSSQEKNTQERYLEFCYSYPNIENRVANYDIANYLGVSPENLSRVRKTLKKLNLS